MGRTALQSVQFLGVYLLVSLIYEGVSRHEAVPSCGGGGCMGFCVIRGDAIIAMDQRKRR